MRTRTAIAAIALAAGAVFSGGTPAVAAEYTSAVQDASAPDKPAEGNPLSGLVGGVPVLGDLVKPLLGG